MSFSLHIYLTLAELAKLKTAYNSCQYKGVTYGPKVANVPKMK